LLHRFLSQNKGTLSMRAREKEFSQLRNDEVRVVEKAYASAFAGMADRPAEEQEDEEG
jgi:hypothetical protein